MHDYLSICLVIYLSIILIAFNTLKKNRQEDENQPYTCPADREGLDRDKVYNFHLPSKLLRALCFGLVYFLGKIANKVDRNKLPEVMEQVFFQACRTRKSSDTHPYFFSYSGKCEINFRSISAIQSKAFFDFFKVIIKMITVIIIIMHQHIHNRGRYGYILIQPLAVMQLRNRRKTVP